MRNKKPTLDMKPSDTPMSNILRKLAAQGGMTAARKEGTNDPFTLWELNMSHAAPLLTNEATILTQRYYTNLNGDDEVSQANDMKTLDYIAKFYLAYHALAVSDRKDALSGFTELYAYLDTQRAREIYAYYTASFLQSFYCYIYTSASMGLGIPKGINTETAELTDTYAIMSQLSDETRRKVYSELQEQGLIPGGANLDSIKKRTLAFTDIITAEQDKQLKKQG
jgi:hypothetical protein